MRSGAGPERAKEDDGRGRVGRGSMPGARWGWVGPPKLGLGDGGGARAQEEMGGESRGLGGTVRGKHGV